METLQSLLPRLTLCAAVACGLPGGVFFAFSSFIMKALSLLPVPAGATAMQSINRTVLNPLFLSLFTGTALVSLALAAAAVMNRQAPGAALLLTGAGLYPAGESLVTAAASVPRNNVPAAAGPVTADGAAVWRDYLTARTRWNHVRTISGLTACGVFIAAHSRLS